MIDYNAWSNDYLLQSDRIKEHIKQIKLDMPYMDKIKCREEYRHIAMLYEISYELKCTAKQLKRRGKYENILLS